MVSRATALLSKRTGRTFVLFVEETANVTVNVRIPRCSPCVTYSLTRIYLETETHTHTFAPRVDNFGVTQKKREPPAIMVMARASVRNEPVSQEWQACRGTCSVPGHLPPPVLDGRSQRGAPAVEKDGWAPRRLAKNASRRTGATNRVTQFQRIQCCREEGRFDLKRFLRMNRYGSAEGWIAGRGGRIVTTFAVGLQGRQRQGRQ